MKKLLSILVSLILIATLWGINPYPTASTTLRDISGHEFEAEIRKLVELGVIRGFPDGTFRPDGLVTRAEIAVMIALAKKAPPMGAGVSPFVDLPGTHWAFGHILAVNRLGFMRGYPDRTFRPNSNVTRAEMAALLGQAKGLADDAAKITSAPSIANDAGQVPSWAVGWVTLGYQLPHRFLSFRRDFTIAPTANGTRGEVAFGIFKVLNPHKVEFINIATGGTGGVYFPLGGAVAEILNRNVPGVNVSVRTTGASIANIQLLRDGAVQMAFIQNDIAYYAFTGTEMFEGRKFDKLRGLATLYPETIQIITLAASGIRTLGDLRGRRVAVGAIGSGTEANARQILEIAGMTYRDISPRYLSFAEAASGLRDGHVDVAFVTAGLPTAAVRDLAATRDVTIVPIPPDVATRLIAQHPFYARVTVPRDTYPKITTDIPTVAVKATLVVTDDMDNLLAYDIVEAIFKNLDRLAITHAMGRLISKETALEGMPIPMKPWADRFFR
ncbi:MAG: Cellulosome-anchoring protein [candidate division WS2 bacterium]|uniref:Cellulosome-anchoring protein n=1 Tax=Psychracetigena formicireducens TaxID=2986056 RepID=A0A9E2BHY7_PSYF1|nr:Cellulosome-anchoring protein [Candidatus Psychracetigena formicireducens]